MAKPIMKCKECGYIEVEKDFTNYDGCFIVPVKFAKTIQEVCKIYKKVVGEIYYKCTGNKPNKEFIKKKIALSHLEVDSFSSEQLVKHTLGKHECWIEDI